MEQQRGMSQSVYPVLEVVAVNGEPIWQVSGGGICARNHSGARALELFDALCRSKGITPPR
ncbi:MAG: hypothetical protein VKM92_00275 [Cyanobacteriota bacterium]|nr:hypothetical protein [Cyanobacteriota bacterium]